MTTAWTPSPSGNAAHYVKSEIHNVLTVMRLSDPHRARESELYADFRSLLDLLHSETATIDAHAIVSPFLALVVTSGVEEVADVALSSVHKFLLYGLISSSSINAREAVNDIASTLTRLDHVGWGASELATMRVIETLLATLRSPAGHLLTNRSVWDVWCSVHQISMPTRGHSALLRRTAESMLVVIALSVFSRLPHIVDTAWERWEPDDGTFTRPEVLASALSPLPEVRGSIPSPPPPPSPSSPQPGAADADARAPAIADEVHGIACMHWLLGALAQLIDPSHPDASQRALQLGLRLINTALEAGGAAFSSAPPLVAVLQDSICKYLLHTAHTADALVLSLALRAVFNLFCTVREHLKVQLEVFFTSMHLRLASHRAVSGQSSGGGGGGGGGGEGGGGRAGAHGEARGLQSPAPGALALSASPPALAVDTPPRSLAPSGTVEQQTLTLESLVEFCREPALLVDLYVNYDCDVGCSNLYENLCKLLARSAIPPRGASSARGRGGAAADVAHSLQPLCFEGVLAMLESLHRLCAAVALGGVRAAGGESEEGAEDSAPPTPTQQLSASSEPRAEPWSDAAQLVVDIGPLSSLGGGGGGGSAAAGGRASPGFPPLEPSQSSPELRHAGGGLGGGLSQRSPTLALSRRRPSLGPARLSAAALRERKRFKQRLSTAARHFNSAPKKAAPYLVELGLLTREGCAEEMASFLHATPALDRTAVGDFLSDPSEACAAVLRAYVRTLDFRALRIDSALRKFLGLFQLPGEAQKIERVLEAFARRYYEHSPGPLASSDVAFVLAYSVIMLNTDLHNSAVRHKMTKEGFLRNNRGINGGRDLPEEYLRSLYDAIAADEIQLTPAARAGEARVSAWGSIASDADGRGGGATAGGASHTRDMFMLVWDESMGALLARLETAADAPAVAQVVRGCAHFASVCAHHELPDVFNKLYVALCAHTLRALHGTLGHADSADAAARALAVDARLRTLLRAVFEIARELGSLLREAWRNVLAIVLALMHASLLPAAAVDLEDFAAADGRPLASIAAAGPLTLPRLRGTRPAPMGTPRTRHAPARSTAASDDRSSGVAIVPPSPALGAGSAGGGAAGGAAGGGLWALLFSAVDDGGGGGGDAGSVLEGTPTQASRRPSRTAGGSGSGSGGGANPQGPPATDADAAARAIDLLGIDELIADSRFLSADSLSHLVNALVLEASAPQPALPASAAALGRPAGGAGPWADSRLLSAIFCIEQLTNVALFNHARIQLLWPHLRAHLDGLLAPHAMRTAPARAPGGGAAATPPPDRPPPPAQPPGALTDARAAADAAAAAAAPTPPEAAGAAGATPGSAPAQPAGRAPLPNAPTAAAQQQDPPPAARAPGAPLRPPARPQPPQLIERGAVCTLRLCIRLLHEDSLRPQLLELLGSLLLLPPQLFAALSERIATGLLLMLRTNAPHMAGADGSRAAGAAGWATVCALLQQLLVRPSAAHAAVPGAGAEGVPAGAAAGPPPARASGSDTPASELAFEALTFLAADSAGAHVVVANVAALSGLLLGCARDGPAARALLAVRQLAALQLRAYALRPARTPCARGAHGAPAAAPGGADAEAAAEAAASWAVVWACPMQALANLLRSAPAANVEVAVLAELHELVVAPDMAALDGAELLSALESILLPLFEEQLGALRAAPPAGSAARVERSVRLCALVSRALLHHLPALVLHAEFPRLLLRLVGTMTGALSWSEAEPQLLPLHETLGQSLKNMLLILTTDSAMTESVRSASGQDVRALLLTVLDSFAPSLRDALQLSATPPPTAGGDAS